MMIRWKKSETNEDKKTARLVDERKFKNCWLKQQKSHDEHLLIHRWIKIALDAKNLNLITTNNFN